MVSMLQAAEQSIHAGLYILTDNSLIEALLAAKARGVQVQVVIDNSSLTDDANQKAIARLEAAAIPVVKLASVTHHHAKYAVVDKRRALLGTNNWAFGAFSNNREVVVTFDEPSAVNDLEAVFQTDFASTSLTLANTSLVLSPSNRGAPQNSRARLEGLIEQATREVFMVVQDINDDGLSADLVAAQNRGVSVRVLMADPADRQGKFGDADWLADRGVQVRYLPDPYLHEKLLVADDRAYVGSHNFTYTAIEANREVGLVVGGTAKNALLEQAELDWAAGVVFVGPARSDGPVAGVR